LMLPTALFRIKISQQSQLSHEIQVIFHCEMAMPTTIEAYSQRIACQCGCNILQ